MLDVDVTLGHGWGFSKGSNTDFLIFDGDVSVMATSRLETAEIARVDACMSLVGSEPWSSSR